MIAGIIGNFKLVYARCSLETCEKRDVKGMYKKARAGEIQEFTGVSAPFEEPDNDCIVVDTENNNLECCVKQILKEIKI